MMELITRTARLTPYAKRPKQAPSFVSALTFEPEADDPMAAFGTLMLVLEVLVSGRPGEEVAELITGTFQEHYYDEQIKDTESLPRFEAAVKAVNEALAQYVSDGNAAWIGKLSAIVAVQVGSELHLTHTGSCEAFLYRRGASTRITTGSGERPSSPAKSFGVVASGQLETGDRLLLATPALIHQVSLKHLHDTITANSPAAAIAEITELLKGTDLTRIAALISEATTPELAALEMRTELPSDITLTAGDTPLDTAKQLAAPLAQATITTGKRAGHAAQEGWQRTSPHLKDAGHKAAGAARAAMSGSRLATRGLIGVAVVAIIVGLVVWHGAGGRANAKLVKQYTDDYSAYQSALAGSVSARSASLTTVLADTKKLAAHKQIDKLLAGAKLPAGAPKTIAGLQGAINQSIDSLNGVVTVSATTVSSLDGLSASPNRIIESSSAFYLVDTSKSAIIVVNKSTKTAKKSIADLSKIGHIVSVTSSSTSDGLYLLTSQPSVWFYSATTDSISQITLGTTGWETGTSIASYGTNLYVLSGNQVQKHVKATTGFAPGVNYFTGTSTVPNPSLIAIDGYVYVVGSDGIYQYEGGAASASVTLPAGLTNLAALNVGGSNQLVGVDRTTNRIGVWDDTASLKYEHQFRINGAHSVSDAVYDAATGTYFAIADGHLVSFAPRS